MVATTLPSAAGIGIYGNLCYIDIAFNVAGEIERNIREIFVRAAYRKTTKYYFENFRVISTMRARARKR